MILSLKNSCKLNLSVAYTYIHAYKYHIGISLGTYNIFEIYQDIEDETNK